MCNGGFVPSASVISDLFLNTANGRNVPLCSHRPTHVEVPSFSCVSDAICFSVNRGASFGFLVQNAAADVAPRSPYSLSSGLSDRSHAERLIDDGKEPKLALDLKLT